MKTLFLDSTNNYLILGLLKNDKIIKNEQLLLKQKFTEETVNIINKTLLSNNWKWNEITTIYLAIGPGSYTSVRVGLTIVKALAVLNKNLQVYTLNSLFLQAGKDKVVSLIDAKSNQYFFAIYNNGKTIIPEQVIAKNDVLTIKEKFFDFTVIENYENVNIFKNFLEIKNLAIKVKNINNLEPFYLKKLNYDQNSHFN